VYAQTVNTRAPTNKAITRTIRIVFSIDREDRPRGGIDRVG